MLRSSFNDTDFINNSTLVAYFDGTGNEETNTEVVDAINGALPGVAHRFLNDGLYVGTASCGFGDEDDERMIDCSQYNVSWLPDIKIYGQNDTVGTSLLRGQFGDRRDVQIALESMGNVLRMLLGGEDNNEDEYEELKEPEDAGEDGSCQQTSSPPPEYQPDMDFEKLDEPDEVPLLDENTEKEEDTPELDKEEEKAKLDEGPRKPKLAGGDARAELDGGPRENKRIDRVAGFDSRANKRRGGGALMGGGGGGGGFIAG